MCYISTINYYLKGKPVKKREKVVLPARKSSRLRGIEAPKIEIDKDETIQGSEVCFLKEIISLYRDRK